MVKHICKLSVHEFVDRIISGGDLVFGGASVKRMQEGIATHMAIQEVSQAKSEVYVSYSQLTDISAIEISGRIDLLYEDDDKVIIEELKSTHAPLDSIKEPVVNHHLQAKCYAAMYCIENDINSIDVTVTYVKVKTLEHKEFTEHYDAKYLVEWLRSKCDQILYDIEVDIKHIIKRNDSASTLPFPYQEYRQGQRNMSAYVYLASRDQKTEYLCAPTGIGKTMASLFPAIRSLGEEMGNKVFYLTSKNTIKQVAAESMKILFKNGFYGRSVTLTAKSKICPYEHQICHPLFCSQAAKYYDRLPYALEEMTSCGHYGYDEIVSIAKKHNICPFELSLDFSLKCDIIICDYNYAFNPTAHLKRFFDDGGDYILLIDEAHNLVDRARDMFSASISKKAVLDLKRQLPKKPDKVEKRIKSSLIKLNKVLLGFRKELEIDGLTAQTFDTPPKDIIKAVSTFLDAAEPLLDAKIRKDYSASLFDMYFELKRYKAVYNSFDSYLICFAEKKYRDFSFKLLCMDPSSRLQDTYDKSRCAVLFSASLTPFSYFMRLLGKDGNQSNHQLPSPFPPENLKVLLNNHISTRYPDRQATAQTICENIYAFVNTMEGCHMIFFPSYKYMEMIYEMFNEMYDDIDCAIQQKKMKEEAREEFLEAFSEERTTPFASFVVMGGIFSEGIDLVGDRLVGAIIVSVGLPQVCFERNLIKSYHMEFDEPSFAYAYQYPGFNKIIQAVGRIIRTKNDKGVALLIGQRFAYKSYRELMPSWWKPLHYVKSADDIAKALR